MLLLVLVVVKLLRWLCRVFGRKVEFTIRGF